MTPAASMYFLWEQYLRDPLYWYNLLQDARTKSFKRRKLLDNQKSMKEASIIQNHHQRKHTKDVYKNLNHVHQIWGCLKHFFKN